MASPQYDYKKLKACGKEVFISQNVEIRRPHLVIVGSYVAIDSGFYCTIGAELGDHIHISPQVTAIGGEQGLLKMRRFNTIAAGSRLISVSDAFMGEGLIGRYIPVEFQDARKSGPIVFEAFASIATNVVVLPGVILGEGSVVAACSLVTKNTEPWTVYAGVPAKPMKKRPSEKMKEYARRMGYC